MNNKITLQKFSNNNNYSKFVAQNKIDWPESQLVPSHAGDSGQHLLYFFIY